MLTVSSSLLRENSLAAICIGMATKIEQEIRHRRWPIHGLGMDARPVWSVQNDDVHELHTLFFNVNRRTNGSNRRANSSYLL